MAALVFFAFTFGVLAFGALPGLRLARTGAAVVGAGAMVASGVLSLEEAWRAIHYETLLLLFGMMIVVANLRLAGFFPWIAQWFVRRAHAPETLLAVVVASNAGSAATITGNPQNVMIGSFSGIPDGIFAAALAPVALFGVVVTYGVLRRVHREEFASGGGVRRDRLAVARPV